MKPLWPWLTISSCGSWDLPRPEWMSLLGSLLGSLLDSVLCQAVGMHDRFAHEAGLLVCKRDRCSAPT